jgi:hypothetical protein
MPYPIRFHGYKPAPLLLVQPARNQVHLMVDLFIRVFSRSLAMPTLTDMNC